MIYGGFVQPGGGEDSLAATMRTLVTRKLGQRPGIDAFKGSLFANVGGEKIWQRLRRCYGESESGQVGYAEGEEQVSSHFCGKCGEEGASLKVCGRCKAVRYCSIACQQADWCHHKILCQVRKLSWFALS
eukprot:TRINITY_DN76598_c0_g1_i1.p1 TRINITY_DN76598_c0_g1~~TRINITY_DN76598_c0_g1_i1.p1  ORF type:complete len:130 (+),score=12.70 TRINITY_DN76598_c0_g1_i1:170-559(+)